MNIHHINHLLIQHYQPLRPSHTLSRKVALPESNRDQLLTALQSLSLRIKTLENEREVSISIS